MIRKFSNRTPEQQHVGLNRSRWTLRLIGVPGVVIVLVWSSKILFPSHPQEQVLGVALRPETAVILEEIERTARTKLQIRAVNSANLASSTMIHSDISAYGLPVIEVPPGSKLTEEQILHELMHINQWIHGFPKEVEFRYGTLMSQATIARLRWVINPFFFDAIDHFVFFPRMRRMGVDPYATSRPLIREAVGLGRPPTEIIELAKANEVESQAIWIFKVALEADDPAVVTAIEKTPGLNNEALRIGKALARIVTSRNPQTPEDVASTRIAALNCLLGKVGSFSFSGWTDIKKGRIVVRKLGIWVDSPTAHDDCADST
jgi:hypothetical protein